MFQLNGFNGKVLSKHFPELVLVQSSFLDESLERVVEIARLRSFELVEPEVKKSGL